MIPYHFRSTLKDKVTDAGAILFRPAVMKMQ